MRVIGIVATYNEERMIGACLDNLEAQGCEFYVMDNDSEDNTLDIVRAYRGRGLVGTERLPRDGVFDLHAQLQRKQELAATLGGDWFIHIDADEICLPPAGMGSLRDALASVSEQGFNAVNFEEFVFIPTKEEPDHDHPDFQNTMRHYYPFRPRFPHRLIAWKSPGGEVDLVEHGGHLVQFPGIKIYPESFVMRHYMVLSREHAIRKYVRRNFSRRDLARGWSGDRVNLTSESFEFPSRDELELYTSNAELDLSRARERHFFSEVSL